MGGILAGPCYLCDTALSMGAWPPPYIPVWAHVLLLCVEWDCLCSAALSADGVAAKILRNNSWSLLCVFVFAQRQKCLCPVLPNGLFPSPAMHFFPSLVLKMSKSLLWQHSVIASGSTWAVMLTVVWGVALYRDRVWADWLLC